MTAYDLMKETNYYLIKGGNLTDKQKQTIVNQLLEAGSTAVQTQDFHIDVKSSKRIMYPIYFVPPYENGKKYKTILNQTPKTNILSANMYELEILRLLCFFAPDRKEVRDMTANTLDRLKTTCFGYKDDGVGECFDASLVTLRFLASAAPEETDWIHSRIENYNRHCAEKKRPWFSKWYYWLCLSELPLEFVVSELDKYKDEMTDWLKNRSCVMNSEQDKILHPVLFCILRNNLARYPEYQYIKDRQPYVSDKDGRLHFSLE